MPAKHVAVLMGGWSAEREVSLSSGKPCAEALETKGIRAFCPRARGFFDNEEIRLIIGCFALVFGYYGNKRGNVAGQALQNLSTYADDCLIEMAKRFAPGA